MDIFSLLTLVGGLALFLFGMETMGDGLVKISGGALEKILEKLTQKRIMAVLTGAMVTAVIQSSSATTVMVVGFVNSGIMQLQQAAGIIMGANIGTTITSWLLSLTGLQGDNLFIQLLKPSSFSPVLAAIGIILVMSSKGNTKKKDIGTILLGFAVLMFGMETMSDSVAPLADNEHFTNILVKFSNPFMGMLAGALLTMVIQSSSASVGILQALCITGAIGYGTALPIIMGQNIGTCVTALISSIGTSRNARRAAMVHLYFNLIGTVVFMIVFYTVNRFADFAFLDLSANAAGIAVIHTCFNMACAICWYPFADLLVKLAEKTIPDKSGKPEPVDMRPASLIALDERFLERPSFAIGLCKRAVTEMAELSKEAFIESMGTINDFSHEKTGHVISLEQKVDLFEDELSAYLVRLSGEHLSKKDSRDLSMLLHCINDLERISDHAVNVTESAQEMNEKNIVFSAQAQKEISVFSKAVEDILTRTFDILKNEDSENAVYIEPLEEVIDTISVDLKQRHVMRLRNGQCSLEGGIILEDIIINYERVSDHCSNIALYLIDPEDDNFEAHKYLSTTARDEVSWFSEKYREYLSVYSLPAEHH